MIWVSRVVMQPRFIFQRAKIMAIMAMEPTAMVMQDSEMETKIWD